MKLFLAQFQVECGIWDEAFYFMVDKFQKEIYYEFSKVYELINQKTACEKKVQFNPQTFQFLNTSGQFSIKMTKQNFAKEKSNEQKSLKPLNKHKSFEKVQKNLRKFEKRKFKLTKYEIQMIKEDYQKSKNWIHKQCYHLPNILFQHNQITATSNLSNIFLFGSVILHWEFTFYLRFDSISQNVSLGIGDVDYVCLSKIGEDSPHIIQYTNDAYLYADGKYAKKEGQGFKVREKIAVTGNLKQRYIRFQVDNQIRCRYEWEKDKFKNLKWVPYVVIDNQDAVSIFQLKEE